SYLREWNTGVLYRPEIPEVVKNLASRFRLAVVTNTHWESLVPTHLANIGIAGYFDAVIMSVQVGRRKPHPAIYAEALNRLRITAQSAIFAGDTYLADYAGPVAAGMSAFVIDPYAKYDVPADRRLAALRDLPVRLGI